MKYAIRGISKKVSRANIIIGVRPVIDPYWGFEGDFTSVTFEEVVFGDVNVADVLSATKYDIWPDRNHGSQKRWEKKLKREKYLNSIGIKTIDWLVEIDDDELPF